MKSLSYKIGLGYSVIIIINIIIAVFAIYHLNRLSSPIKHILIEKYQNVNTAENMLQILDQQELIRKSLMQGKYDSTLVIRFHTYKNEFYNWHQRAIEGIALPAEPDILDSLLSVFNQYILNNDSLFSMIQKNIYGYNKIKEMNNHVIIPLKNLLKQYCFKLMEVNRKAIADADIKAKTLSDRVNFVILIFLSTAILISILASIRFTKSIIKPIKETTEVVRKIGKGQLNQKIAITTTDEIAELGSEFNKMTERLDAYERMNINKIILEKKKSEAIVENMPVAIIVTDDKYNISLMNDSAIKILNISGNNFEGKHIKKVVKEKHLIDFIMGFEGIPGESFDPGKSLLTIKRGIKESYYIIHRIEITGENNHPLGIVTILQDVTSFKNLDRLKTDFIANMSHEFKTPLTSIDMATDILIKGVKGEINKEQKELLCGVKSDCTRLKNFIKDLLDLSRLEAKKYQLNIDNIPVKELVDYALQPLKLNLINKDIKLKTYIKCKEKQIPADFHQLSRVLTNLVDNAIQHTRKHGEIVIEVIDKNNNIRFSVEDYGEGIPEDAIDLIFDKFVHIKNFKETESGNIGLGLAIAKEIINNHNGKIWVKSKLGEGSQFYFEIPLITMNNRTDKTR